MPQDTRAAKKTAAPSTPLEPTLDDATPTAEPPGAGSDKPTVPSDLPDGITMIAAERERQVSEEGWTAEHDLECGKAGALALAAAAYALPAGSQHRQPRWFVTIDNDGHRNAELVAIPPFWPWAVDAWKPTPDDRVRELTKAGALCAAEIDRLVEAAKATEVE